MRARKHTHTHNTSRLNSPEAVTWLLTHRSCGPAVLHYDKCTRVAGSCQPGVSHQILRGVRLQPFKAHFAKELQPFSSSQIPSLHLLHSLERNSHPPIQHPPPWQMIFHTSRVVPFSPKPAVSGVCILVTRYDTRNT